MAFTNASSKNSVSLTHPSWTDSTQTVSHDTETAAGSIEINSGSAVRVFLTGTHELDVADSDTAPSAYNLTMPNGYVWDMHVDTSENDSIFIHWNATGTAGSKLSFIIYK